MPTFGSLFAGIGGIDLGLERAGWTGRWQVEWSEWCQHNLGHHWPDVPRFGDITTVDWSLVEPVDLIAGGFPCQPFSNAGKRLGKSDDRWLWPEFARAIGALRPSYVLVENVPGLLAGHGGMGAVLGDLADLGYDAEWDSIPASALGAPHLRYRVWVVAYPARPRDVAHTDRVGQAGIARLRPPEAGPEPDRADHRAVADADRSGLEGRAIQPKRARELTVGSSRVADPDSLRWDGRSGFFGEGWRRQLADSRGWEPEPGVGRLAHGVPGRVDRLRALGNAVVPQVVEVIGRQLLSVIEAERVA